MKPPPGKLHFLPSNSMYAQWLLALYRIGLTTYRPQAVVTWTIGQPTSCLGGSTAVQRLSDCVCTYACTYNRAWSGLVMLGNDSTRCAHEYTHTQTKRLTDGRAFMHDLNTANLWSVSSPAVRRTAGYSVYFCVAKNLANKLSSPFLEKKHF